jgi:hypothetical protein
MIVGGLPQLDVARVQRWCAKQVPEHLRGEIRVECDVTPRHLTICECRPVPDRPPALHQDHRYQPLEPSSRIQGLLDYLDSRADPIFWG